MCFVVAVGPPSLTSSEVTSWETHQQSCLAVITSTMFADIYDGRISNFNAKKMRSETLFPFLYTLTPILQFLFRSFRLLFNYYFILKPILNTLHRHDLFVTFRNSLHITVIGSHLQNYVNFSLFFLLFFILVHFRCVS